MNHTSELHWNIILLFDNILFLLQFWCPLWTFQLKLVCVSTQGTGWTVPRWERLGKRRLDFYHQRKRPQKNPKWNHAGVGAGPQRGEGGERSYQPYTCAQRSNKSRVSVYLAVGALGGSVLKINKHLQGMRKGSTERMLWYWAQKCVDLFLF